MQKLNYDESVGIPEPLRTTMTAVIFTLFLLGFGFSFISMFFNTSILWQNFVLRLSEIYPFVLIFSITAGMYRWYTRSERDEQ